MDLRTVLEYVEASPEGDLSVRLAYLAVGRVAVGEEERNGALRRALLLLATGGDPRRELDLEGRAVAAVARDLDDPARRRQLDAVLSDVEAAAGGLPHVAAAASALRRDPELAWRRFAAALVADQLSPPSNE